MKRRISAALAGAVFTVLSGAFLSGVAGAAQARDCGCTPKHAPVRHAVKRAPHHIARRHAPARHYARHWHADADYRYAQSYYDYHSESRVSERMSPPWPAHHYRSFYGEKDISGRPIEVLDTSGFSGGVGYGADGYGGYGGGYGGYGGYYYDGGPSSNYGNFYPNPGYGLDRHGYWHGYVPPRNWSGVHYGGWNGGWHR